MMYSCGEEDINCFTTSVADFRSSADLIQRTSPWASILKMSKGGSMKADSVKLARRRRDAQAAERPKGRAAARLKPSTKGRVVAQFETDPQPKGSFRGGCGPPSQHMRAAATSLTVLTARAHPAGASALRKAGFAANQYEQMPASNPPLQGRGVRLRLRGFVGGDGIARVQQLHADAVGHLGLGLNAHDFGGELRVQRAEGWNDVQAQAHVIGVQARTDV